MISNLTFGSGFKGLVNYLFRHGQPDAQLESEYIGGSVPGQSATEIASSFSVFRKLRPDIKKPVLHVSLSLSVDDGRKSKSEWNLIISDYLIEMGLEDYPFAAIRHSDHDYDHCHIAVSRVNHKSQVFDTKSVIKKSIRTMRKIEDKYKLTKVNNPHERVNKTQKPTKGKIKMLEKENININDVKMLIRERLARAKADLPGQRTDFLDLRMAALIEGVALKFVEKKGKIVGVTYQILDEKNIPVLKGSELGDGFRVDDLIAEFGIGQSQSTNIPPELDNEGIDQETIEQMEKTAFRVARNQLEDEDDDQTQQKARKQAEKELAEALKPQGRTVGNSPAIWSWFRGLVKKLSFGKIDIGPFEVKQAQQAQAQQPKSVSAPAAAPVPVKSPIPAQPTELQEMREMIRELQIQISTLQNEVQVLKRRERDAQLQPAPAPTQPPAPASRFTQMRNELQQAAQSLPHQEDEEVLMDDMTIQPKKRAEQQQQYERQR